MALLYVRPHPKGPTVRFPNPAIECLNLAHLLPPSKAAARVGNFVSYLLHVPISDEHVQVLSSPDMTCTLDLMLLPSGTPIVIPTLRSEGAELRVLVPLVGRQARAWVRDCLMLGRMELLLASKSRAGCLCISIENHTGWFRAAAEAPTRSARSRSQRLSELLEAAKLLRENRSADIVDQSFWGLGASLGGVGELGPAAAPGRQAGW